MERVWTLALLCLAKDTTSVQPVAIGMTRHSYGHRLSKIKSPKLRIVRHHLRQPFPRYNHSHPAVIERRACNLTTEVAFNSRTPHKPQLGH